MTTAKVDLLPHQMAVMKSGNRYRVLVGGTGSGKTALSIRFGVYRSFKLPGTLTVIVSPTHSMSTTNIEPLLLDFLENSFEPKLIEGIDYSYRSSSPRTLTFLKTGSQIRLVSADNPRSLKGFTCATVIIDEFDSQSLEAFQEADRGCRDPRVGADLVTLFTGTYEDDSWAYDFFEGDMKFDDLCFVRATTYDNTFLDPSYVKNRLMTLDPLRAQSYIYGKHVSFSSSLAYYQFDDASIRDLAYDPSKQLLIGLDYNWNPNTAVIGQEQIVDGKASIVIFDEFYQESDTQGKCEEIISRYPAAMHLMYPDAAGKNNNARAVAQSDFDITEKVYRNRRMRFRIDAPNANPLRKDRINAVNTAFKNAIGDRTLYVHSGCKNLIQDLKRCTREGVLTGKHKDKSRGHITDALGYLVHYRKPSIEQIKSGPVYSGLH